jgi:hypothetical protein
MYEPGAFNLACGECLGGHVWEFIDTQVRANADATAASEASLVDDYLDASAQASGRAVTAGDVALLADTLSEARDVTTVAVSAVGDLMLGLEELRAHVQATPCDIRPRCARLLLFADGFDALTKKLADDMRPATEV